MNRKGQNLGSGERWSLQMVGREMAGLIWLLESIDGEEGRAEEELQIALRLEMLENAATVLAARNPEEGLVQVMVLARLRQDVALAAQTVAQERGLMPLLQRMDSCLWSLARLLVREGRVSPGSLPIEWYLGSEAV